MTLEELERELQHFATKEDLAALESRLLAQLIASERGQRMWVWGLYALVIISYFVRK